MRDKNLLVKIALASSVVLALIGFAMLRLAFGSVMAAQAAPARQIPIYTPTPGPDGRIIYIVKANDTLLSISLLTGVSVDQLRSLNNLNSDTIYEGQKLLLGFAGPAEVTVTAGPTPTLTPILPTSTPKPGKGKLCIMLYNDLNGDSIREESEPSIPDGAISFGNRAGTVSQSATSVAGLDPKCFEDLPEGNYTITVAIPVGYNPTTGTTSEITLKAGNEVYINFGAQANSETLAQAPAIPPPEGGRSPLLGILGALFLLAGLAAAVFAGRLLKKG